MESAYFVTPLDSFKCSIFNGAEPKYGVDASFIFTGIDNINGVGIQCSFVVYNFVIGTCYERPLDQNCRKDEHSCVSSKLNWKDSKDVISVKYLLKLLKLDSRRSNSKC